MVLPKARAELREALSALIAGRLLTDQFDDVYYRLCVGSPDLAVIEIGKFAWGLYSSDLLWPYYLASRYAASAEAKAIARRCELFLQSSLEYDWPPEPSIGWVQFAQAFAVTPGFLISLLAAIMILLALSNSAWSGAALFALVAFLVVVPGLCAYRWLSRYEKRRWAAFWNCGSQEAWPFLSEIALEQAIRACAN